MPSDISTWDSKLMGGPTLNVDSIIEKTGEDGETKGEACEHRLSDSHTMPAS